MYEYERKELERQARLRQEMKMQDARRFQDPDREDTLTTWWVVYSWSSVPCCATTSICPKCQHDPEHKVAVDGWVLEGFRRIRNRKRKPQTMNRFFAKIRRKFELSKTTEVLLMDLQNAALWSRGTDQSWRFRPPTRQIAGRPNVIQSMAVQLAPKHKVRRIRGKMLRFHKRHTQFIALGRVMATDKKKQTVVSKSGKSRKVTRIVHTFVGFNGRELGYTYLGPLASTTASDARREAARAFGTVYTDLLTPPVASLPKRWRNGMHRARKVVAGVTVFQWPPQPDPVNLRVLLRAPSISDAKRSAPVKDIAFHVQRMEQRVGRYADKNRRKGDNKMLKTLAILSFLYRLQPTTLSSQE